MAYRFTHFAPHSAEDYSIECATMAEAVIAAKTAMQITGVSFKGEMPTRLEPGAVFAISANGEFPIMIIHNEACP